MVDRHRCGRDVRRCPFRDHHLLAGKEGGVCDDYVPRPDILDPGAFDRDRAVRELHNREESEELFSRLFVELIEDRYAAMVGSEKDSMQSWTGWLADIREEVENRVLRHRPDMFACFFYGGGRA